MGDKRAGRERGESPAGKKRRSESFGQTAGGGQRGRVSDVSTSAVSFFSFSSVAQRERVQSSGTGR